MNSITIDFAKALMTKMLNGYEPMDDSQIDSFLAKMQIQCEWELTDDDLAIAWLSQNLILEKTKTEFFKTIKHYQDREKLQLYCFRLFEENWEQISLQNNF